MMHNFCYKRTFSELSSEAASTKPFFTKEKQKSLKTLKPLQKRDATQALQSQSRVILGTTINASFLFVNNSFVNLQFHLRGLYTQPVTSQQCGSSE